MLEHQCGVQKGEEVNASASSIPTSPNKGTYNLSGNNLKYIPGLSVPQQPMFIASILSALKLVSFKNKSVPINFKYSYFNRF